jgi:hypothetical protein
MVHHQIDQASRHRAEREREHAYIHVKRRREKRALQDFKNVMNPCI